MSSLECPPSPVYRTSVEQKLLSRNAARQCKFGSPKLRDLLREKCRVRVRESRRANFDGARKVGQVGNNTLVSKILRQELADLESDLDLQQHIYKELIGEMNMWYVQQLEEEDEYLIEGFDTDVVFCPVCQKAALEQKSMTQQMVCQCGVSFNYSGTLQMLNMAVQNAIGQHETKCDQFLNFFIEQNLSGNQANLNAFCENCDFFVSLT